MRPGRLIALLVGSASGVAAQSPYTPLVWDENWAYLADRAKSLDWSDELKHVDVGLGYLSLGGQTRERGEVQDYPNFAATPAHVGYLLQRYLFSADWQASGQFRMFVQLGSGLEEGRDAGPRPGIDQDTLSLNQVFFDYSPVESVTVRVGRQLVSLGSTRLFAIGAGLNVEQPFDGVRLMAREGGWDLDVLALRPVRVLDGYFQNQPNGQVGTWGLYATHPVAGAAGIMRREWVANKGRRSGLVCGVTPRAGHGTQR